MKTLLVYYSRTGNTRKTAVAIARAMGKCDIEEILEEKGREGVLGFIVAGFEASRDKIPPILPMKSDPSKYDLVIIGTPVWAGKMASPVRTYIRMNRKKFARVAFFGTLASHKPGELFDNMKAACRLAPDATMWFSSREMLNPEHVEKIEKFVLSLKQSQ